MTVYGMVYGTVYGWVLCPVIVDGVLPGNGP